ncbi:hypothetical protein IJ182_10005 [bacterium]|nr:hypothetical protein [bacterium]
MKKNIISLAILTVSLIFCSSPAFCQTNYYHNPKHPPKYEKKISYNNKSPHKITNKKYKKVYYNNYNYGKKPYYTNHSYTYNNPKYYSRHINPYTYQYNTSRISNNYKYKPTLLERIFNL